MDALDRLDWMNKFHQLIPPDDLLQKDRSFKFSRYIVQDGQRLFPGGVLTIMSKAGFVLAQCLMQTETMEEEEGVRQIVKSIYDRWGHPGPSYMYADDPDKNQGVWMAMFSSLKQNTQSAPRVPLIGDSSLLLPSSWDVTYASTVDEIDLLSRNIMMNAVDIGKHDANSPAYIGVDAEWEFDYSGVVRKVALIQLAVPGFREEKRKYKKNEKEGTVYLFHVHKLRALPSSLSTLLTAEIIQKVGVSIDGDVARIYSDFSVKMKPVISLGRLAKRAGLIDDMRTASMVRLVSCVSDNRISLYKDADCQKSGEWESTPLSRRLQQYAALDAYASYYIHNMIELRMKLDTPRVLRGGATSSPPVSDATIKPTTSDIDFIPSTSNKTNAKSAVTVNTYTNPQTSIHAHTLKHVDANKLEQWHLIGLNHEKDVLRQLLVEVDEMIQR